MSRFGSELLDAVAWVVTRVLFRVDSQDLDKLPMKGPFILICNHVSSFEVPVLRTLVHPRRIRALAKAEAWDQKLMGWILDQWESIPIKRGESDMAAPRTSLQVLRDGGILAIMPGRYA